MSPPAAPAPGQRERVDDRPGAGVTVELVKPAQNALAMHHRGRRVTAAGRRLPGHRVGYPGQATARTRGSPGRKARTASVVAPARAAGLDGQLDPAAKVPGLRPRCLIPRDLDRPQEPEPAQRSEEHTSELQSPDHLVCRLLLEKKTQQ